MKISNRNQAIKVRHDPILGSGADIVRRDVNTTQPIKRSYSMNQAKSSIRIPPTAFYLSLIIYAPVGLIIIWLWQGASAGPYLRELLTIRQPTGLWVAVLVAAAGQLYLWATKRGGSLDLPATEGVVQMRNLVRDRSVAHIPALSLASSVCEEILFRAALLGLLASFTGDLAACLIIAALFGLAHVPQYRGSRHAIAYVFILGLFLNALFIWYGDLWGPIILHFLNNLFNFTWMRLGYIRLREAPDRSGSTATTLTEQEEEEASS